MDFGTRLKSLRQQAGLTQKQLADRLGLTKSVVSFYELRERMPSPEILIKLSSIFHVSTDYLLGLKAQETIDVSGLDATDIAAVNAVIERLRNKSI